MLSLQFCSFLGLLWLVRAFYDSIKILGWFYFRVILGWLYFYFCEKCYWNFYRSCTESVRCFGLYGHFNNINFSNPWARNSIPFIFYIYWILIIVICWKCWAKKKLYYSSQLHQLFLFAWFISGSHCTSVTKRGLKF